MANGHEMGDADINDGYLRKMRAMAVALDRIFNGDLMGLDRKTGFVLLVFPFSRRRRRGTPLQLRFERRTGRLGRSSQGSSRKIGGTTCQRGDRVMPISINEAVRGGVERLRLDHWANPADHIKITIVKDPRTGARMLGPWWELWSPINEKVNGRNPVRNLVAGTGMGLGDLDEACWTIYAEPETGPDMAT